VAPYPRAAALPPLRPVECSEMRKSSRNIFLVFELLSQDTYTNEMLNLKRDEADHSIKVNFVL
jgi:hypothetical protein